MIQSLKMYAVGLTPHTSYLTHRPSPSLSSLSTLCTLPLILQERFDEVGEEEEVEVDVEYILHTHLTHSPLSPPFAPCL